MNIPTNISLEMFSIITTLALLISLLSDIKINKNVRWIVLAGLVSLVSDVLSVIFYLNIVFEVLCGITTLIFIYLFIGKYKTLAYRDGVTGLYNRNYLNHLQVPKIGTVVVIDIDKFKNINDKFGHKVGDQVLIDLSNILRKSIRRRSLNRKPDYIIRFGGDEYVIIIPNPCKSNLIQDRIASNLAKHNMHADISISISMGSYEFVSGTNTNIIDLIDKADKLMFRQKQEKNSNG